MSRVSTFTLLVYTLFLAAQIHAANLPPPWNDPSPTLRPFLISDPIPTTYSTSTVSIECGNNACQSAWATAFTSSNPYIQPFCSSFTSPGRKNTLKFDKKGPATACTKRLGNAAIQSSLSSVCSCYAAPGIPTQAFITRCPTCPPIQTQTHTQTITTSIPIPTTILEPASTKIITTIIRVTPAILCPTSTSCTTTTTNVQTTTLVTAIYDYFTYITTTTYQAGRYPYTTTIYPSSTVSISTVTFSISYCNQTCETSRASVVTVTSTVTAGLPFGPSDLATSVGNEVCAPTFTPTFTTTLTLVIDPLSIEYTVTTTVTETETVGGNASRSSSASAVETATDVFVVPSITGTGTGTGSGQSEETATVSEVIIDDGGFTFRGGSGGARSTGTGSED
ncbi:hypothetical protein SBOR_6837 [Sclerotinia borealis F-4128]|uniref:Uncharacterized protein n=1 Tax=Sclerotinia borealis (strain F-4128) TaxID=1432307 RepID=W9CE06_SCLBF|nr:hypothetical protein SBOR_6837 [Sclerotinia borealis F-4128]